MNNNLEGWEQFRFVQYNILTQKYSNPTQYPTPPYEERDLGASERLHLLKTRLQEFIAVSAIICLQEVDLQTSCELSVFFKKNKYEFYCDNYGGFWNGNMGCGIALPWAYASVVRVDKWRIIEGRAWKPVNDKEKFAQYTKMQDRDNRLLSLEICYGKNWEHTFWLGCVHIPCDWQYDVNMITYTWLTMKRLSDLAGNKPFVLCGDFNFDPASQPYQFICSGELSAQTQKAFAEAFPPDDMWLPKLPCSPLVSAAKSFRKHEPLFTTHCLNAGSSQPYTDTLDYIFISDPKRISVRDCWKSPDQPSAFLPNYEQGEPSDHLPIWAELKFD